MKTMIENIINVINTEKDLHTINQLSYIVFCSRDTTEHDLARVSEAVETRTNKILEDMFKTL